MRGRILITGSRDPKVDWSFLEEDWMLLFREYFGHACEFVMVHGGCPTGVDAAVNQFERDMSRAWWSSRNADTPTFPLFPMIIERHPVTPVPGYVGPYGPWPAAGPRRNQHMVDLGADLCLAYPYGVSRGTRGCAAMAIKAGIPTLITEYEDQHLKPRNLWERLAASGIEFPPRPS